MHQRDGEVLEVSPFDPVTKIPDYEKKILKIDA
jgi:hypothetical protein